MISVGWFVALGSAAGTTISVVAIEIWFRRQLRKQMHLPMSYCDRRVTCTCGWFLDVSCMERNAIAGAVAEHMAAKR